MAKTLTIRISSLDEGLKRFRETYQAVEGRRPVARREGVYFTRLAAAKNLLTPSRLALLRAVSHRWVKIPHAVFGEIALRIAI